MWPGSKSADIWNRVALSPHASVWVTGSLKHPWGRRRHRQFKLINLTQAFDGGVTTMWLALSHPSSGMLPPWIKNVFFLIADDELLLPVREKIVRLLTTASHCNTQQHALYLCSDGDETTSEDRISRHDLERERVGCSLWQARAVATVGNVGAELNNEERRTRQQL